MTARGRDRAAWTVALLAAALLAYGAFRLFVVGSCESDPPPGTAECPPDVAVYSGALAGGILLSVGAAVGFGFGPAFGTAFTGAGAGISAGSVAGDRLWGLLVGLPFLAIGGAAIEGFAPSLPKRDAALRREGRPGTVTVLDVEEVHGATAPGTHRVRERVRVEPRGGEAYDSERARVVDTLPMVGERYAVLVDPADPHHWIEA